MDNRGKVCWQSLRSTKTIRGFGSWHGMPRCWPVSSGSPRMGGCRRLGWRGWSHVCSPGFGNWRCDQELSVTFQVVGVEAVEVTMDLPVNTRGPSWRLSPGRLGCSSPRISVQPSPGRKRRQVFQSMATLREWGLPEGEIDKNKSFEVLG